MSVQLLLTSQSAVGGSSRTKVICILHKGPIRNLVVFKIAPMCLFCSAMTPKGAIFSPAPMWHRDAFVHRLASPLLCCDFSQIFFRMVFKKKKKKITAKAGLCHGKYRFFSGHTAVTLVPFFFLPQFLVAAVSHTQQGFLKTFSHIVTMLQ